MGAHVHHLEMHGSRNKYLASNLFIVFGFRSWEALNSKEESSSSRVFIELVRLGVGLNPAVEEIFELIWLTDIFSSGVFPDVFDLHTF